MAENRRTEGLKQSDIDALQIKIDGMRQNVSDAQNVLVSINAIQSPTIRAELIDGVASITDRITQTNGLIAQMQDDLAFFTNAVASVGK